MRSDAQANRDALLKAAAQLLEEQGAATSMRAVAQQAGVGIGTLYRHFASREELFAGLFGALCDELDSAASRFHQGEAPMLERWEAYVRDIADLSVGGLAIGLREATPEIADSQAIQERRARTLDCVEGVLAEARDEHLVAPDVRAVHFVVCLASLTRRLPYDVLDVLPDYRDWVLRVYLRGIR